jgi:DNA-binding XRE family transcriptional regulator
MTLNINAAFLHCLKPIRQGYETGEPVIKSPIVLATLAHFAAVEVERLRGIDNRTHEPTLPEAYRISRVLNLDGILPLIHERATLDEMDCGIPLPTDVEMLRSGEKLPLSLACRVAIKLGLPDPILLIQRGIDRELWRMVLERSDSICPFCRANLDEPQGLERGHTIHCLPDHLYGARDVPRRGVGNAARTIRPGKRSGGSGPGLGVATQRKLKGLKQLELAERMGVTFQYLSKLETGYLALTIEKAHQIAALLGCDEALLFVAP